MKRVWGHILAATALLAGGGAAVSACVHDNSTLYVRNVLAQQLVTNGQQCVWTSDPTQTFISNGVLDIGLRSVYDAVFLVGNQTVARGDPNGPKAETSRVTIEGGIVKITDEATGAQLANYTTSTATTVDPQVGNNPSFTPAILRVVDDATVMKLAPTIGPSSYVRILTHTRIFGHTLGGQYVESDEFQFPIDVCYGCLVSFAPQNINPNWRSPNCGLASSAAAGGTALPAPCMPGQDIAIDCSQCSGLAVCNPNVPPGFTPVVADAGAG
jgi:hypothetical protein